MKTATVQARPATTTAVLASAAVVVAKKLGLELTVEEAATLVAAATLVVGWFTPRT